MTMTRIRFLRLALTLALTGIVAAGCDDSSGPGDDIDGNYSLRTINGAVLPFVLLQIDTQFKAEVTSGQLELRNDGTFNETLTFRVTEDGDTRTETDVTSGTWSQFGNQITFSWVDPEEGPESWNGTLQGSTITFIEQSADGTFTLVYRR